jgi:hypothetical protein
MSARSAPLVLVLLMSCAPGVVAQEASALKTLVDQLGSDSFVQRDRAAKMLEQAGVPALVALRSAEKHGDLEVRRRAAGLVQRIEEKVLATRALQPQLVRLRFADTPLADAVLEVQRRTGLQVTLAEDPELARRAVTVDTGLLPTWQAWESLCRQAGVSDAPNIHPRLRLSSSAGPAPVQDGHGPFRVRFWSTGGELRVVVQAEPSLAIVSYDDLRLTGLRSAGKPPVENPRADISMSSAAPAVRTPVPGASWAGAVRLYNPPVASDGKIEELRGELRVCVQVPRPLVTVAAVVHAAGAEREGSGGLRLKVLDVKLADDGDLSLHVRLAGLAALPPSEQKIVRVRPGVVALRGPADMALDFLEVDDALGRKIPWTQAVATLVNDQTADFRLTCQPRPGSEEELQLVLAERRVLSLTVPFVVRDVPVP